MHQADDFTIIRIEGDLDMLSSPALDSAIRLAARDIPRDRGIAVSLDLCKFCDASGLTVLVRAKKLLGPRFFVVISATNPVRRIFRITQLESYLPVESSLQDVADSFVADRVIRQVFQFRQRRIAG